MKISIITLGIVITFIAVTTLLTSCGGRHSTEEESIDQHDMEIHEHGEMASDTFACPMHPEITGKEGEKCSKCGMALVLNESEEPTHQD